MKRILTVSVTILFCMLFLGMAIAATKIAHDPLKEEIAKLAKANNGDIDPVVVKMLEKGTDPRALVKSCIEMGYEACKVTMVAIREKADRQMVIFGALDGGATNEQLALCEGLGYSYDPTTQTVDPQTPRGPVSNIVPVSK
jgi:hypothetical protein